MVAHAPLDAAIYVYLAKEYAATAKSLKKAMKVKEDPTSELDLVELVKKAEEKDDKDESSEEESSEEESSEDESSDDDDEKKEDVKKDDDKKESSGDSDDSDDSDDKKESSDEDSSSDDDSDDEEPAKGEKKDAKKEESTDDDDDSSDDDDKKDSDKEESSEEESSDDDDSDDSDASKEEEEEKTEEKTKKRKHSETEDTEKDAKKTKTEEATDPAATSTLFCGGISWGIDEDGLYNFLGAAGFEATDIRIITDRETGRSKGFGYVEFKDAATAQKCKEEMVGKECDGRPLRFDFSEGKKKAPAAGARGGYQQELKAPSKTIFVGNLSFDADNDALATVFEGCEDLVATRVATNREDGSSRGFGYAQFNTVDGAKQAMEQIKGAEYSGRALRLDFAEERQQNAGGSRPSSPRGGGRGGARGGMRGGRGGRGGARGGSFGGPRAANRGAIAPSQGTKMTFD